MPHALRRAVHTTLLVLVVTALAAPAQAASFLSGDVVVYRVGDGTPSGLDRKGSAVFLDEYTPGGTLVQSIALPTLANGPNLPLVASGTATSEGQLGRSADAQYLLITGYDSTLPGGSSLSGTTAAAVPRVVGRVKFDGTIDTSTALTDFADGNNPRSAASTDGSNLWIGGAAGGVRYATLGGTTSTQLSGDSTNIRYVGIFDGQLYMSTQNGGTIRIGTVGSGTPITTGQSITNLPGLATSGTPDAFFFADLDGAPGVDTLYVADEAAGLQKFSLSGGKWFTSGTAGVGGDKYRGVTGTVSGITVTLYATRKGDSGGELVQLVDSSGFNENLNAMPTLVASAASNEAFRGVAMAPMGAGPPPVTATPTATPIGHTATATATVPATPTRTATVTATGTASGTVTVAQSPGATSTPSVTGSATTPPTQTPTSPATGAFTPGDLVVYRLGDGAATLTDNGNAVFLDEYHTDGTPAGTMLVQSVALPTTASGAQKQLLASTDVSEGILARSTDNQYIMLTGYGADLGGGTTLFSTSAATVPRVVGRVKYDGSIDTSTALSDFSSANNPRSATSTNGTDIWVGGASGSSGGVHYTTLGSTTSTQLFASIPKGVRQANIFGGQLYFDSNATGFLNVSTVGVGTPTTGGQSGMELPGLPDSAGHDGYFFVDLDDGHGLATLYVANDSLGEILKYSLVSGSWMASGNITAAGVHGVTCVVSGATVTLYATGTTGNDGTLYGFIDTTGYNGTVSGVATTLLMAPANEAFRGVALAPMGAGLPPATATPNGNPATPTSTEPVTPTHTPIATDTAPPSPEGTNTPIPAGSATQTPTVPSASSFTPGDVVVYRVGDGISTLINTGNAVFLDEYAPGGSLVQSIALPTTASGSNQPLVASGTAASEGQLGRSVDGHSVLLTGYATTLPGAGSLSASSAAMVPRVVGRVKFDGSVDTSTALTDFSDGNNPRSAVSTDGTNLWAVGAAGGVRYATLGSTTSTQVNTDSVNDRYVTIFDGQLYVSSQKLSVRVGAVGSGTPTTSGQTTTNLPGFPTAGSPEAFFFADLSGGSVLYVADDAAGLEKFSLVSGNWVANGTVGMGTDLYNGLTGTVSGDTVTLYATRKASELAQLVDGSGFNGALSGSPALVATAGANQAFRGVALVPVGSEPPPATETPTVTPTSTVSATATATIVATVTATNTQPTTSVPTLTATPTVQTPVCVGDCDGGGTVTVSELVKGVNIALGSAPLLDCPSFACEDTQQVPVACLVRAVNAALDGCPK